MKPTLLYITFIEPNMNANSGSAVRPFKMLQAFEKLDINLIVLYGVTGIKNVKNRKQNVKKIIQYVSNNPVDFCYVEPPSGPMFCKEDRKLLKILHKKNIPIAVFYRDCFWMFPESYLESGVDRLKLSLIKHLSKLDLKLFYKVCRMIYYPSESMAELIPQYTDWEALPPGGEYTISSIDYDHDIERINNQKVLTFFYVGGATYHYGADILLKGMDMLNSNQVKAYLTLVCPQEQWDAFPEKDDFSDKPWLHLYHLGAGEELEKLYLNSDICVIPQKKATYSDFVVNVKLYEYIAHAKPILTTNCYEVSKVVNHFDIGWITQDQPSVFAKTAQWILEHPEEILVKKENCKKCLSENTWDARAHTVIEQLTQYTDCKHK